MATLIFSLASSIAFIISPSTPVALYKEPFVLEKNIVILLLSKVKFSLFELSIAS